MNYIDKVQEDVEVGVTSIPVEVPVRVKMQSINDAPFEFTASIDEIGQIILTPTTKDVEFITANTDDTVEYEVPVKEQPEKIETDDELTIKEVSIILNADMLCENDNMMVSADVDEIGQCVVYPMAKENSFLSVTFGESLNLITEDMQVEEYCGYKLINNGDGWDVVKNGDVVEEGIATINEAKIFICKEELRRLEHPLTEAVESKETSEESETNPEVTAEVIEEALMEPANDNMSIINRFMRGDIALFSDNGSPLESYVHIEELDSNGYEYYYDPESDAVVSYPAR